MIEAYAIGVAAKLEDGVTPGLLKIIDALTRANSLMQEFSASVRSLSKSSINLSRSLEKSALAARLLGDSSGSLTRASYVIDTMATSSAELARNMAAARANSAGMGRGGSGGGSNSGSSYGYAGGRNESNAGGNAAAGIGLSAAYGIYENARLQDLNIRSAATSQLPMPMWIKSADDLQAREFAYARKYAFATGGKIAPFGEAMLESSRLLRTLSPDNQKILTDAVMPYAAVESKLKGIDLPESVMAFIGLAHQAGAYSPNEAKPLFEAMLQTSLSTHASLGQITRASSYALPALHAAGANSSDVLMLLATMMQGGILNTKSGTWLNNMAMNALPNSLGSGLFSNTKQNAALNSLGLYTHGKSNFYKNGHFDLMAEVAILAADRLKMNPLQFNAATRHAFGIQGQRAASLFSEPQVVQNLHALAGLTAGAQTPVDISKAVNMFSTVAKADQTIANANMTLMNATTTFSGPANSALSGAGSFFGWTADYTKKHPVIGGAMDIGLAAGGIALAGGAWHGSKALVNLISKKALPFLGKAIWSVITRAFAGIGAELLNIAMVGAASLAGVSALTITLGTAIAGSIGYGIGFILNKSLDWAINKITGGKEQNLGGAVFDLIHPHANQAPVIHTHVYVDSHEVAHAVAHNMPVQKTGWMSGVNPQHSPMNPGLNFASGL